MIEITCRYTGKVLFRAEAGTIREAVEAAVKAGADLSHADLRGADLSLADLRGAYLSHADLRGADLSHADLRGADLTHAYLRGADLSHADLSHADLRGAYLTHAYLSGADLSHADLRGADLRGADLSLADLRGAYLSHADLRGADLRGAYFSHTDLRGADLSHADLRGAGLTYANIPVIPDIHKAIAAAVTAEGAVLDMRDWHGEDGHCGTTHCRAGWAIHLAGDAGRALEEKVDPSAAAALIYQASDPALERVPDFHASNMDAMADIMQMAEGEAA